MEHTIVLVQLDEETKSYYSCSSFEEALTSLLQIFEENVRTHVLNSGQPLKGFKYEWEELAGFLDSLLDLGIMKYNADKNAYDFFGREAITYHFHAFLLKNADKK